MEKQNNIKWSQVNAYWYISDVGSLLLENGVWVAYIKSNKIITNSCDLETAILIATYTQETFNPINKDDLSFKEIFKNLDEKKPNAILEGTEEFISGATMT